MTSAHRDLIVPRASGWFHLVTRCVRRAFLCGANSVSGCNYDHISGWIRDRLRFMSEGIARRADREDTVTGRFWERRFKSQALLDESAVLA